MKLSSRLLSGVLACSLPVLGGVALEAGDYPPAKAPIPKVPIEECIDVGGTISAGYKTDYILHGLRTNRDTIWVDVNYNFPDLAIPLTLGVSHYSGINTIFPYQGVGPLDETAVYLGTTIEDVYGFDISLGYKHRFINFSNLAVVNGSYGDICLGLRRDLGFADFVIGSCVGMNSRNGYFAGGGGEGWIHYAGLEKSFSVTDYADLVVSGGVGYHDNYYFKLPGTSDWSHYYINAALPIDLNCRATLTPYLGYNGVQQWGVFAPQGDALHGGVSLSVDF